MKEEVKRKPKPGYPVQDKSPGSKALIAWIKPLD